MERVHVVLRLQNVQHEAIVQNEYVVEQHVEHENGVQHEVQHVVI